MSSFGGTVKLSGESEYKRALSEITSNLKVMSSEMQIVTATYGKNDTSVQGLSKRNEVLNKQIDAQKEKVEVLKNALEQSKNETGENSSTTQKWQTELNKATAQLVSMEKEVKNNEDAMQQSSEATDENAKSIEDFGKEADKSSEKALSLGDIIKANLISDAIKSGLNALASGLSNVASSFTDALKNGSAYADNLITMSVQTGMSVESLQKYQAVSELVDVSLDTLTGSMAKNIKSMSSGKDAYDKLGVSIKDANGNLRDSEAVYWESIDALAKIEDSTERDAIAMEIFGKSAQDLNPLIAQGSEGISELTKEAEKMGAVLSQEGMEALGSLDDEMQKSAVISQATGNILASAFAPAVSSMLGSVNDIGGAFNNLIASILGGDDGGIEEATNQFVGYIEAFVNNIGEQIPKMLEIGTNLISTLISTISSNLPKILDAGVQVITSLLNGITSNLNKILPVVVQVILSLATAVIQNLPTILEAGIQVLLSLIEGIAQSLPELIPVIVDAIITMVEAVIDNIDLIIDAGISIIFGLIDGLIEAMPKLIDKIPEIIDKLIIAITNNLPKLIEAGIILTIKLAEGLIKAIPQLVAKIPQIITSLVKGLANGVVQMASVGLDLIKGLWDGIKNSLSWIKDKIKGWVGDVFKFIKKLFGINSPSRLFRDEIGTNLAKGIGVGFTDEMDEVNKDIENALPTDYDVGVNTTLHNDITSSYNSNVLSQSEAFASAVKDALDGMYVKLDDDVVGQLVVNKVEDVIYS